MPFFIHSYSQFHAGYSLLYSHKLQSLSPKIKSFPPFITGNAQTGVHKEIFEKEGQGERKNVTGGSY
ncbi:MAG TPA: hypothetical protein DHW64_07355 [Chitinophagaceae bacterium]|nr:hypothetical protein [Chitinophagaceae bacterium]